MIENVELVNFISHKDTTISLEDGVNVFIGANGSGKSSVVDAITYALYGEHTRDLARNILRRGAAGGSVSVRFGVGDRSYLAERRFGRAGKLETATLRELAPNPRLIVAGERKQYEESMSEEVAKTFGLDYEKMKVAAIVQQGELDAIIRYKPKELKELLNNLIGIDKLDRAFQNMREALDIFRLKLRAECMNFDDQSFAALEEEIRSTAQRQEESEAEVREISARLSALEREREKLDAELATMEPLRGKKRESEDRRADLIKYVKNKLLELGSEKKKISEVIDKAKKYLPVLASKQVIESESTAIEREERKLGQTRTELTSDLRSAKTAVGRAKTLEDEIQEGLRKIKKLDEKARQRRAEISKLKSIRLPTQETVAWLNHKLEQVESSLERFRDSLTKISEVIGNYKQIQTNGVCPTCDSTVEEINLDAKLTAKHKEHTEAKSKFDAASREKDSAERLLDKRKKYDAAQKRLDEQTELLNEYTSGLRAEKRNLASRRKEARAKSAEARRETSLTSRLESIESKIAKIETKKRSFRKRHSALIEAETWLRDNGIAMKGDITQFQMKLKGLQGKIRSFPRDLTRSDLKNLAVDDYSSELVVKVSGLEKEAIKYDEESYQDVKKQLDERIRPKIRQMTGDQGGWKQRGEEAKERVSKLGEARTRLEAAMSYVRLFEKIRTDVYNRDGVLATSLRSWALKELSRNASDYIRSFGIGLSELQLNERKHEVNIECYSASGMADVKSMSGGEGVAIALALRFAMARLMGKGMVDFIALDEPTTHLDEERKRSLVRLVTEFNSGENRTSLNQIIVITHDREIFEDSEVNAVFQFEKTADGTSVAKS